MWLQWSKRTKGEYISCLYFIFSLTLTTHCIIYCKADESLISVKACTTMGHFQEEAFLWGGFSKCSHLCIRSGKRLKGWGWEICIVPSLYAKAPSLVLGHVLPMSPLSGTLTHQPLLSCASPVDSSEGSADLDLISWPPLGQRWAPPFRNAPPQFSSGIIMHHKQYMLTRVNPRMQWSTVGRRRLIMNSNIPKCFKSRKASFFFFYRPLQVHSHSTVQIFSIYERKKSILKASYEAIAVKKKSCVLEHSMNSLCKLPTFVNTVDTQPLSLSLSVLL